jgi:uncharacterized protein
MKRRAFMAAGGLGGLGALLGAYSLSRTRAAAPLRDPRLRADPAGLLDLLPGFSYRVISREGERMTDGHRTPGRPDAMACFALPDGRLALMRNHEIDSARSRGPCFPGMDPPPEAYDRDHVGGVSRLVLDARGEVLSTNLVLAGTARNCAAGPSPWGYLSCEESVQKGHGFVFLCDIHAERVQPAHKIAAYGRFLHEAVAIDPSDHAAYLTEDRNDGCLYRFVPARRDAPFGAGRLEALAVRGRPRCRLYDEAERAEPLPLRWVEVPHAAGDDDELRHAAQARGAAVVRRGEGIWRLDGGFAFTSTTGGHAGLGQIFELVPSPSGGTLTLLYESRDRSVLDMPDNLTFAPWGDLLVCEDNQRECHLRIVTRSGRVLPFARNALNGGELAGVTFSPGGRLLFVNIQEEGLTLAIEGPFGELG